jgi:hypothetical protein
MRRLIIVFLIGVGLGVLGPILYYYVEPPGQNYESAKMLDWLITEWTRSHEASLAGFPARVELPNARPGFFPDTVRKLANEVELQYNIPHEVTLSQWALESSWGRSNLGVSNYFGHTFAAARQYMEQPVYVLAREKIHTDGTITLGDTVRFARYKDIAECFSVHGRYLSESDLYAAAFRALKRSGPEGFALQLSGRYATDPDYGLKLVTIMRRYLE